MTHPDLEGDLNDFLKLLGYDYPNQIPDVPTNIFNRIEHLEEELSELAEAASAQELPEVIDGLIDLIYLAVGTIIMSGADFNSHWREVHSANMRKKRGTTKRGHAFDAIKPEGWLGPDHERILIQRGWKAPFTE